MKLHDYRLKKALKRKKRGERIENWRAILGDGAGNVKVEGFPGLRYVRPVGSSMPLIVRRGGAVDQDGAHVWIGRDELGRLKIRGLVGDDGSALYAGNEPHADTHYLDGSDPVWIDESQVTPLLCYASSGMTVHVNAGIVVVNGQVVQIEHTDIDMTSYVPSSGAVYYLVRVPSSGAVSVQAGTAVGNYADLGIDDVPACADGYAPLAFVRLYEGQTALSTNVDDPDVRMCVWGGGLFDGDGEFLELAGGTMQGDIDFDGYKAIAMACDNGATLPTSPSTGQWFLHTPTGRKVLMQYDGTQWQPIISYGSMTMYVDGTSGTDDQDKGFGTGTDAFATIQFAIDQIPGLVSGNVTINIAAGTYSEDVVVRGKYYTGNYKITLTGVDAMSTTKSGTVGAGSVQGTGGTQGTLVDNAGGMTADVYKNKLIKITSGTLDGKIKIVDSNSSTTYTIVGTWETAAPSSGDTYEILDWGVNIDSITVSYSQANVTCEFIKVTGTGTWFGFATTYYSFLNLNYCYNGSRAYVQFSTMQATTCMMSSSGMGIQGQINANIIFQRSKQELTGNGSYCAISEGSSLTCRYGSIIDGYVDGVNKANYGVHISNNAVAAFSSTAFASYGYPRIRNCDTGIYAVNGGQAKYTAQNQYSGNTTDENAVAASYGYID